MRYLGVRNIPVAELVMPVEVAPFYPRDIDMVMPVARRMKGSRNYRMLAGVPVAARALKHHTHKIPCSVVECDDVTAELLSRIDWLQDRDFRYGVKKSDVVLTMVNFFALKVQDDDALPLEGRGRYSARAKAVRIAAATCGLPIESIRTIMKRHHLAQPKSEEIRHLGASLSKEWLAESTAVKRKIRKALTTLDGFSKSVCNLPVHDMPDDFISELVLQIREMRAKLKSAQPYSLCPYCRGMEELQNDTCKGCRGRGWIAYSQVESVPQELWDTENPRIVVKGKMMLLSEYVAFWDEQPGQQKEGTFGW